MTTHPDWPWGGFRSGRIRSPSWIQCFPRFLDQRSVPIAWKSLLDEERQYADLMIHDAVIDHLDRHIDDHGQAQIGDPAEAFDIFGDDVRGDEIGRASGRERGCQYV